MNKLKELWGNNKVLIVLGFILLICVIAIICVTISFFFGKGKSIYGNRLEDLDNHPITEVMKNDVLSTIEEHKEVTDAKIEVMIRTIYVTINFAGDTSLLEAEAIAASSLAKFDDDTLDYYDVEFTLVVASSSENAGFTIKGARNSKGNGLKWNNNTPIVVDEEE